MTTSTVSHTIYCDRLDIAMDDLRDRGVEFDGSDDIKVLHEIESQLASGYTCDCANDNSRKIDFS